MAATHILTNAATVLVVVALWVDLRDGGRLTTAKRAWLLIAGIFSGVSAIVGLFH